MENGALDDALEPAGRGRIGPGVGDQRAEFIVEIMFDAGPKFVAADPAGGHHLGRMFVVDQRDQQMLERRIFVATAVRFLKRIVQRLFEFASETWHDRLPARRGEWMAGFTVNVICLGRAIKGGLRAYPQLIVATAGLGRRGGAISA